MSDYAHNVMMTDAEVKEETLDEYVLRVGKEHAISEYQDWLDSSTIARDRMNVEEDFDGDVDEYNECVAIWQDRIDIATKRLSELNELK